MPREQIVVVGHECSVRVPQEDNAAPLKLAHRVLAEAVGLLDNGRARRPGFELSVVPLNKRVGLAQGEIVFGLVPNLVWLQEPVMVQVPKPRKLTIPNV